MAKQEPYVSGSLTPAEVARRQKLAYDAAQAAPDKTISLPIEVSPDQPILDPSKPLMDNARSLAQAAAPAGMALADKTLSTDPTERAAQTNEASGIVKDIANKAAAVPEENKAAVALKETQLIQERADLEKRGLTSGERIALGILSAAPMIASALNHNPHGDPYNAARAGSQINEQMISNIRSQNDRDVKQKDVEIAQNDQNQKRIQGLEDQVNLEHRQEAQDIRKSDRMAAHDVARINAQTAADGVKETKKQKVYEGNFTQKLMTYRGDTGAQQASASLLNIDRALDAINDPRVVKDNAMVHLIASEMEKVATGAAGTGEGRKALESGTAWNKLKSGIQEQLTNDPKGVHAEAFLNNYKTYLENVSKSAHETLYTRQKFLIDNDPNLSQDYLEKTNASLRTLHRLDGAPASAPQANKPQTVRQNGHTYTLNPSTGQYE